MFQSTRISADGKSAVRTSYTQVKKQHHHMKKLTIFSLLCAAPIFAQSVTTCTGQIMGPTVIAGDLTVPAGARCTLFAVMGQVVEVQGNVTVEGTLDSWGAHFSKNIFAVGGNVSFRYDASLQKPTIVDGDVLITHSNAFNAISSVIPDMPISIMGNLTVAENGIDPNGNFSFFAYRLKVGGNFVVSNNGGRRISLYNNTVGKNLNCGGNNPAPEGTDNAGKHKNGQCSSL
jgi:hypothetical protein